MPEKPWWKRPMRVIQYNLQVRDTWRMDPEKIARETEEMHANVVVVNVGGIYAWYASRVPYHHVNEYLPKEYDLLQRLIDACHKRGIRVMARFDFSKAEDAVSQVHPEWFVRNPDGTRRSYGMERPGNWSILYLTCANAGYRNEEVAVPVLEEAIDRYAFDGIFLNAPHYDYCTCQACQEKYERLYGKPLPIEASDENAEPTYGSMPPPKDMEPDFPGRCYKDNIGKLYAAVKRKAPDMPFVLYYANEKENLRDRLETADLLCSEAQDILSRGWTDLPPMWLPTLVMKYGRCEPRSVPPFGIIHSCPGMDWRHTGLPTAEYRSWLRQIPAAGGNLWHSLTGFCDTIADKRILDAVGEVNAQIARIEGDMENAKEQSDVLLLWNDRATYGWVQVLVNTQTQFDVRQQEQLTDEGLSAYTVVVVPDGLACTPDTVARLHRYVQGGGRLVVEATTRRQILPFADLLGVDKRVHTSEPLTACYWRFEEGGKEIFREAGQTLYLAHRGVTAYTRALDGTKVLATLVPPFAPLNSVGAPPERASMLVDHTDIPLCTWREYPQGGAAVLLPFRFSQLADQYRLAETYALWHDLLQWLAKGKQAVKMECIPGIIVSAYANPQGKRLIHLVNAVGQRPLTRTIPCTDFSLSVPVPRDREVSEVKAALGDAAFEWKRADDCVQIHVSRLCLWEMFCITLRPSLGGKGGVL